MQNDQPSVTAIRTASACVVATYPDGRLSAEGKPAYIYKNHTGRLMIQHFVAAYTSQYPHNNSLTYINPADRKELLRNRAPGFLKHFPARKNMIEEEAEHQIQDNGVEQVVVIGGGIDPLALVKSRQFPHVSFIEFDHPATQAFKLSVVNSPEFQKDFGTKPPNLQFVADDLNNLTVVQVLKNAGYDPRKKTFFLLEGVLPFVPIEASKKTLSDLYENSVPGSVVIMGAMNRAHGDHALGREQHHNQFIQGTEPILWRAKPIELWKEISETGWGMAGIETFASLQRDFRDEAWMKTVQGEGTEFYMKLEHPVRPNAETVARPVPIPSLAS